MHVILGALKRVDQSRSRWDCGYRITFPKWGSLITLNNHNTVLMVWRDSYHQYHAVFMQGNETSREDYQHHQEYIFKIFPIFPLLEILIYFFSQVKFKYKEFYSYDLVFNSSSSKIFICFQITILDVCCFIMTFRLLHYLCTFVFLLRQMWQHQFQRRDMLFNFRVSILQAIFITL